jgi:hypothetical protein
MVGGEPDIVTTGAIVITAAIGTDAGGRAWTLHCDELRKAEASRQAGSIMRRGYASGALARGAGDLWQGKAESIGQPASPRLREHR